MTAITEHVKNNNYDPEFITTVLPNGVQTTQS